MKYLAASFKECLFLTLPLLALPLVVVVIAKPQNILDWSLLAGALISYSFFPSCRAVKKEVSRNLNQAWKDARIPFFRRKQLLIFFKACPGIFSLEIRGRGDELIVNGIEFSKSSEGFKIWLLEAEVKEEQVPLLEKGLPHQVHYSLGVNQPTTPKEVSSLKYFLKCFFASKY